MKESLCNCCEGIQVSTPVKMDTEAGLSTVNHRSGTYADFKASLLSKISVNQLEGLKKLTTRSDDDFTIALLDAFSVMADVLTFYQERIANESYLRTATERLSVAELAALMGYELNPGVAATTHFAFTMDEASLRPGDESLRNLRSAGNEKPIVTLETGVKVQSIPEPEEIPQIFETVEEIDAKADWNSMEVKAFVKQDDLANAGQIYINGLDNNLKKGDRILVVEGGVKKVKPIIGIDLITETDKTKLYFNNSVFPVFYHPLVVAFGINTLFVEYQPLTMEAIGIGSAEAYQINTSQLQSAIQLQNWSAFELSSAINSALTAPEDETKIYVFRNTAALFGYNAPERKITIAEDGTVSTANQVLNESDNFITLDAEYKEVTGGDDAYVALKRANSTQPDVYQITSALTKPQSKYGISGKSTSLYVDELSWTADNINTVRSATAYIQSERLSLAQKPITEPLEQGSSEIILSKFYVDLKAGQKILISGEIVDLPGIVRTEIHILKEVDLVEKYTRLTLEKPLSNSFVRSSTRINANVALATHGETVNEALGSGDTTIPFQKFQLKHAPVTYVADDSPSGSSSSIQVRVNDILWKEVSHFYGKGPKEHIYVVRRNNDGTTTITFGDGITGSRLPTGKINVRAIYRKGIGSEGLLKNSQLTQLIAKPLYVKSVNNPLASAGAQNPEEIEYARSNANLSARTLDRVVSLKDYEDFARSFAGIEKAKSVWIWSEVGKLVHMTVAGAEGNEVEADSELMNNLITAIRNVSYPGVNLMIKSFRKRFFRVVGKLSVHQDYSFEKVHDEVMEVLKYEYSFQQRQIGQNIHLSEVIASIESVQGINYVDIDQFYVVGSTEQLNKKLVAKAIKAGGQIDDPSELIMIDPAYFEFTQV